MAILIIFNREPYDTTDMTWNGLRLADKLVDAGSEVRLFLMNDAVDLARDTCRRAVAAVQSSTTMRPASLENCN